MSGKIGSTYALSDIVGPFEPANRKQLHLSSERGSFFRPTYPKRPKIPASIIQKRASQRLFGKKRGFGGKGDGDADKKSGVCLNMDIKLTG